MAERAKSVLDAEVGRAPSPADDIDAGPFPPRLSLNVLALILGPFWYLLPGLWVHFIVLISVVILSLGLLAPFVWIYAGLKANEDYAEARRVRWSVY